MTNRMRRQAQSSAPTRSDAPGKKQAKGMEPKTQVHAFLVFVEAEQDTSVERIFMLLEEALDSEPGVVRVLAECPEEAIQELGEHLVALDARLRAS